jgi:hypothetical protein
VNVFILREDLDLYEMLIRFEEGELLEKSFPSYLVVLSVVHHMLGDFHCLFYFCQHDVSCRQRNVVS